MKDKNFIPMSQRNTLKLIYFGFRDPRSQPQVNEKVDNWRHMTGAQNISFKAFLRLKC